MAIDADGYIYAISNDPGNLYRYTINGNSASAELLVPSTGLVSGAADATMCPGKASAPDPDFDYGDAPDLGAGNGPGNYNTLVASNGPRHTIVSNLYFGSGVTAENDALQNANATGDADDAAASMPQLDADAATYSVALRVYNNTGRPANVYGWVDFNNNGLFQANEAATVVVPSQSVQQTVTLTFTIPAGTVLEPGGVTFARFRVTTDSLAVGSAPQDGRSVGPASDGEVEDYQVSIKESEPDEEDFGNAPDLGAGNGPGNYNTLPANNGPRHTIVDNLYFGSGVTAVNDALQSSAMPQLDADAATYSVTLRVYNNTGRPANVYGWVDFNNNGLFEADEAATAVVPSQSGPQTVTLTFAIPAGTVPEPGSVTYARFRVTTDSLAAGGTQQDGRSVGAASDGEVEDYAVYVMRRTAVSVVYVGHISQFCEPCL